jgi:hypothetical protein
VKQTGYKMVKIDKQLHAKLKLYALKNNKPLYKVVDKACSDLLEKEGKKEETLDYSLNIR